MRARGTSGNADDFALLVAIAGAPVAGAFEDGIAAYDHGHRAGLLGVRT